ncbi:DNA ligase [Thecamonas trahens ATCC 50062]|uniref:DNA ligase n=1 Tax=Thecamonas trahens ATCC 50062 TaxID=461836 RepID=A0A0L0DPB3_THETB|nr:DNA ligase [Thecamonas trahens ATCC 50062]KNC54095.1 DNA ligase [Thecamonas trahens ATCC 50062]|eukprot:XP_013754104.1 DNA ligase [Thecamonas trahens ATCC 50062]
MVSDRRVSRQHLVAVFDSDTGALALEHHGASPAVVRGASLFHNSLLAYDGDLISLLPPPVSGLDFKLVVVAPSASPASRPRSPALLADAPPTKRSKTLAGTAVAQSSDLPAAASVPSLDASLNYFSDHSQSASEELDNDAENSSGDELDDGAASSSAPLPACKYGVDCYRKNPAHFAAFSHPYRDACGKPKPPAVVESSLATPSPISLTSAMQAHTAAPAAFAHSNDDDPSGGAALLPLVGKHIVLTGALTAGTRKAISARLVAIGALPMGSVSSRTHYLVAGDKPGSKLTKAQNLGVAVVLEPEFMAALCAAEGAAPPPPLPAAGVAAGPARPLPPASQPACAAACALLLPRKWELERGDDPTGWWLSEKLDGVRAYWDGSAFYSRLGNQFNAPPEFTAGLPGPDLPLDGELFLAHGAFQTAVGAVRSSDASRWATLTYCVFDAPPVLGSGRDPPFETRFAKVQAWYTAAQPRFARIVDHIACTSPLHLTDELERIEAMGGEGVMLRQAGSRYVRGRSQTLRKLKSFHDAEAIVVAHTKLMSSAARHAGVPGLVGSLRCRMANGTEFSVGSGLSDAVRAAPPPIGAIITYRFTELTDGGVPRHPRFVGERVDMTAPKDWVPTR